MVQIDVLCAFQAPFLFLLLFHSLFLLSDHSDSCTVIIFTTAMIRLPLLPRSTPKLRSFERATCTGSEGTKMGSLWQYTLVRNVAFIFFHPCHISSRGSAPVHAQVRSTSATAPKIGYTDQRPSHKSRRLIVELDISDNRSLPSRSDVLHIIGNLKFRTLKVQGV